jgi:hypothetical protein
MTMLDTPEGIARRTGPGRLIKLMPGQYFYVARAERLGLIPHGKLQEPAIVEVKGLRSKPIWGAGVLPLSTRTSLAFYMNVPMKRGRKRQRALCLLRVGYDVRVPSLQEEIAWVISGLWKARRPEIQVEGTSQWGGLQWLGQGHRRAGLRRTPTKRQ